MSSPETTVADEEPIISMRLTEWLQTQAQIKHLKNELAAAHRITNEMACLLRKAVIPIHGD